MLDIIVVIEHLATGMPKLLVILQQTDNEKEIDPSAYNQKNKNPSKMKTFLSLWKGGNKRCSFQESYFKIGCISFSLFIISFGVFNSPFERFLHTSIYSEV